MCNKFYFISYISTVEDHLSRNLNTGNIWTIELCQSICFMITHFLKNHIRLITEEQVAMSSHMVMVNFCQTAKGHPVLKPILPTQPGGYHSGWNQWHLGYLAGRAWLTKEFVKNMVVLLHVLLSHLMIILLGGKILKFWQ